MAYSAENYWGNIQRLRVFAEPELDNDQYGNQYETGRMHPTQWELQCKCGHVWTIFEHDFPGRRQLRDCGRPECEYANPPIVQRSTRLGRPRSAEPSTHIGLYLPLSLALKLQTYASENELSLNKAAAALLNVGLVESTYR